MGFKVGKFLGRTGAALLLSLSLSYFVSAQDFQITDVQFHNLNNS